MNQAQELALALMAVIADREPKYEAVNGSLKELQSDFAPRVNFVDSEVWGAMVRLIDAALGDSSGSYFLEECRTMKGGGKVIEADGTEWPMRSVDDVRAYVAHLSPSN